LITFRHIDNKPGNLIKPRSTDGILAFLLAAIILVFSGKTQPWPEIFTRSSLEHSSIDDHSGSYTLNILKNESTSFPAESSQKYGGLKQHLHYLVPGHFLHNIAADRISSRTCMVLDFYPQKALIRVLIFPFHFFW
jgi:hypothetical protein